LVKSRDEQPVVWGCWSTGTGEAQRLMDDIFVLANGGSLAS
jgi:hypothetical protein